MKEIETQPMQLDLDENYQSLLGEIKVRLKEAQLRAAISLNQELIQFYWDIGQLIIQKQQKSKWGDKLFDIFSNDLQGILALFSVIKFSTTWFKSGL